MKKLLTMVMAFMFFANISFAQETPSKTKMFGVNPLGLITNIYSGHYGMIINDGASELNFPFFFWKTKILEQTILGGGIKYRIYKKRNGKGRFHAGTVHVTMSISQKSTTGTIKNVTFTPGGETGYRWVFDSGFTLAPTIGLGLVIPGIVGTGYSDFSTPDGGFFWSLELGLAYLF